MATWPTLKLWVDFVGGSTDVGFPANPEYPELGGGLTDVGAYVQSASVQRGMSRFEGTVRYEAGTMAAELDNTTARFDALNTAGPYYGQIKPRRAVALQAVYAGTTYYLWRGFGEEWRPVFALHGKDARTWLRGVDGLSIFANADADLDLSFGSGVTTGTRIAEWMQGAEADWVWDVTTLPVGGVTLAQVFALAGNVLAGMQLVADTELGELYFDGSGHIKFRLRTDPFTEARSNHSQGTFDTGASLPFADVVMGYDAVGVRNEVRITRVGGAVRTALDQTSIDTYQRRSFIRDDLIHTTNAESQTYADYVLYQLKDPELRIESITINPQSAPATLWPHVLGRELGDRITVAFTPPGGTAISRDCYIRGITHTIGKGSWLTRWALQDAGRFDFEVFDDAVRGVFDSNRFGP